jgi:hypothetical protein
MIIIILSRTRAGHVTYNDVDDDWHWIYSVTITTTTDYNHWEQLSIGSFLNPSCELVVNCFLRRSFLDVLVSFSSLRALTGTLSILTHNRN